MNKQQLKGSQIAKNGFANENDIIDKFKNWKNDIDAQEWIQIMGYTLSEIEKVIAIKIPASHKSDIQVQISIFLKNVIDAQNIQVKLVSNNRGFNQIDRRWISKCEDQWEMPQNISDILKHFTGELPPNIPNPKDKRRMFMYEFTTEERNQLVTWLNKNKTLIVSDIIKGRGQYSAEWMLVAQKISNNSRWALKPINYCLNFYGNGDVVITKQGSISIGKIRLQRKGGDGGRPSANQLQFKIDPTLLFNT